MALNLACRRLSLQRNFLPHSYRAARCHSRYFSNTTQLASEAMGEGTAKPKTVKLPTEGDRLADVESELSILKGSITDELKKTRESFEGIVIFRVLACLLGLAGLVYKFKWYDVARDDKVKEDIERTLKAHIESTVAGAQWEIEKRLRYKV